MMTLHHRRRAVTLLCALLAGIPRGAAAQSDPSWTEPFEPFRVAGTLYFVGTRGVSSFLFTTPEGHILLDTGLEEGVPLVRANIEKLGLQLSDIRIILSTHAHFDHVEGHAEMQRLTGATVMAVGQDAAALRSGTDNSALGGPGWKPVDVGRVLEDGDVVTLGGTTLTAHHTPGHTKGCTTWTTTLDEDGRSLRVVIVGGTSINANVTLLNNRRHPGIVEDYARTFRVLRELRADIFLAQHPSMFRMEEKLTARKNGRSNSFVDADGFREFVAAAENAYLAQLARERSATAVPR